MKKSDKLWKKTESSNPPEFFRLNTVRVIGNILITSDFRKLRTYNLTDLNKTEELDVCLHEKMKVVGEKLYLFGEQCVEIVDVSKPENPKSVSQIKFQSSDKIRSGAPDREGLYITNKNTIARIGEDGKMTECAVIHNDEFFGDYPNDITIHNGYLYAVGRHAGLHIFKILNETKLEFLKNITVGYTPTDLSWFEIGKMLVLIGNEYVIAIDVSNPEKARRLKAAKLPGTELCNQYIRKQNSIYIAGLKKDQPFIASVMMSAQGTEVKDIQYIEHFERAEAGNDRIVSVIERADQVLVWSYHRGLGIFKT